MTPFVPSQAPPGQPVQVSPAVLASAGTQLDALAEALRQALASAADGLAATAVTAGGWSATPAIQHALTTSLATLRAVADLTGDTAAALRTSANAYLGADQRSDERHRALPW